MTCCSFLSLDLKVHGGVGRAHKTVNLQIYSTATRPLVIFSMKLIFLLLICVAIAYSNEDQSDANDEDVELIDDEVIIKCLKNGDNDAYQKAKHARQKLATCGTSLLHTDKVLPEVRAAIMGGGRGIGPIIKKVCKSYQALGHQCLNQYLGELKPCLNESQTRVEELVVQMSEKSWEYACQKDGLRAQMFFKNSTISCFEETSPEILQCIAPYFPQLRAAGDPTRAVAQILANQECSAFLTAANCIVAELKKCNDQTAANLVSGSFNETLSVSPCKDFATPFMSDNKKLTTLQSLLDAQSLQMVLINKLDELVKKINTEREEARQQHFQNQENLKSILQNQSNLLNMLLMIVDETPSNKESHRRSSKH